MKEDAVIFYLGTGCDTLSQKIELSLCIFSDSFVIYSCSCHVLFAEIISHLGEFDKLFCVRTYTRIRTTTFEIF